MNVSTVGGASYRCGTCSFELWHPIAELSVSTLGLYDDGRFPGRSLLALNQHHEEFVELHDELLTAYLHDLRTASTAIRAVTSADRLNYAVLGNAVPHVHFHIIPRIVAADPAPRKAPWESPLPRHPLPPEEFERLLNAVTATIGDLEPSTTSTDTNGRPLR